MQSKLEESQSLNLEDQSSPQLANIKTSSNGKLREESIRAAVKFLCDPKVTQAPLAKKIAFLESKGLTGPEIEESIVRSRLSTFVDDRANNADASTPPSVPMATYQQQQQQVAGGLSLRDMLFISAIIGSAGCGIFYALKTVAADWFGFDSAADDQNLEVSTKIDDMLAKMESNLEEMRIVADKKESDLEILRREVVDIKEMLMVPKSSDSAQTTSALSDFQSEIRSLKSLLLNRRQFPPILNNQTATSSAPVPNNSASADIKQTPLADPLGMLGMPSSIPSWQLSHQVKPSYVDIEQEDEDDAEKENQSEVEAVK